jgi:hypothetical protein
MIDVADNRSPDAMRELVEAYAASFKAWFAARQETRPLPASHAEFDRLERLQFLAWWRLKGPLNFRNTVEAVQFREMVWEAL